MKLSDDLKEARIAIEKAIQEAGVIADGRCVGAGRSYGVEARWRDQIPHSRDRQKAPKGGE